MEETIPPEVAKSLCGERRSKKYKWRYRLAVKAALIMFMMFTLAIFIIGWLIYKNVSLSKKLDEAKIIQILPNGKTLTSKVNK